MSTEIERTEVSPEAQRMLERMAEAFAVDQLPEGFQAYGQHEVFLKDLMMNVKKFVAGEGAIDASTRALITLATAVHARSQDWVDLARQHALAQGLSPEAIVDAIAIVSTNYMYNTFFKFRSLSGTDRFDGLPVSLRAHTFSGTSLSEETVELINIAISDLNACQPCVSGHVGKAKKLGLSDEQVQEAIQCAAVVYAGSQFLGAERMLRTNQG